MRHPWRQENYKPREEDAWLVQSSKRFAMGGRSIDHDWWSRDVFSRPWEGSGHLLLTVWHFRWADRDKPDYLLDGSFGVLEVPMWPPPPQDGDDLVEEVYGPYDRPPYDMSPAMLSLWHEERARDLSVPCPVSRAINRKAYGFDRFHGQYREHEEKWQAYRAYQLRGISPILDARYKEFRREMRKRDQAARVAVAEAHL